MFKTKYVRVMNQGYNFNQKVSQKWREQWGRCREKQKVSWKEQIWWAVVMKPSVTVSESADTSLSKGNFRAKEQRDEADTSVLEQLHSSWQQGPWLAWHMFKEEMKYASNITLLF